MKRLKSDIPPDAVEQVVSEYSQEDAHIDYQIRGCLLNGQLVGRRAYAADGTLIMETPLQNGQKHGREITWNEDGTLLLVEPYVNGQIHGTAKQYGSDGQLIGTYRLVHGTGYDIWRQERGDGHIVISEVHSLKSGLLHGYEWWFTERGLLWHERHWRDGQYHGIERMWNSQGKLKRGYPKYWIAGKAVTKQKYLQAIQTDKTLPIFRMRDNSPRRKFPPEIEQLLVP
ncbi:MAG: hypothetical protein HZB51_29365 [Chloroflexi bacterium]|nr:hypothetical protein [Chloroflexota bacterium]